jgi:hypothetical protein
MESDQLPARQKLESVSWESIIALWSERGYARNGRSGWGTIWDFAGNDSDTTGGLFATKGELLGNCKGNL